MDDQIKLKASELEKFRRTPGFYDLQGTMKKGQEGGWPPVVDMLLKVTDTFRIQMTPSPRPSDDGMKEYAIVINLDWKKGNKASAQKPLFICARTRDSAKAVFERVASAMQERGIEAAKEVVANAAQSEALF